MKRYWGGLWKKMWAQFLTGILVLVPVGVTIWVLVWIFFFIDDILQPIISSILGRELPGIGFAITVVLIYLVGLIARNVGGKKLISYGDSLLAKVPIVRQIYNGVKQILESFQVSNNTGFVRVVLIEFPKKGMRAIGFVTNETYDKSGNKLLNVFIPTSPNPTSGFLEIVREGEVIATDISVDDALKMVVSAGKVSANDIGDKLSSGT